MDLIIVLSILIRATAFAWSLVLLRRLRDWRMGLVSLLLALMTMRQLLLLVSGSGGTVIQHPGSFEIFTSLLLSAGALLVMVVLHQLLVGQQRARAMFERAEKLGNLGYWVWDVPGDRMLTCSEQYAKILGRSVAEVVQLANSTETDLLLMHPDDRERMYGAWEECRVKGKRRTSEYRVLRADGTVRNVYETAEPVFDAAGNMLQVVGTVQDITERKKAEVALRDSEARFRGAFDESVIAMALVELDGRLTKVNDALCRLLGYSQDELMGLEDDNRRTWEKMIHPDDLDEARNRVRRFVSGEVTGYTAETRYIHKSGATLWIAITLSAIHDEQRKPKYLIAMLHDITEKRELSEQLAYQASHDALTGLVNRREFERRVERVLKTSKQDAGEHALCYLDLDQFKVVNDTCGHSAGDQLLRQLSMVLQHTVRKRDTLARLGGDEFGILMEHCPLDAAQRVVTTLQEAIQDFQFSWQGRTFRIGVSIGLVPIRDETSTAMELLQQADLACYVAKEQGRNRVHVYHIDDAEQARRHGEMQWVTRIYQALEEDRFCLYAQPIVPISISPPDHCHYELLLRMQAEDGEHIPPGAFLPAAERYNLITRLDRWVIEQAIRTLHDFGGFLPAGGFFSINLSGQSLVAPDMQGFIVDQLQRHNVAPEQICFEITETAAIANLGQAMGFIATLRELGCRFALDDFGSGLSSFGYLKNLKVDYLKIDGMFVRDMVNDPIDHAMVRSINEIGQVMAMKTIAEFVENDEIKGMIREIGLDYAQGYGVGKPQLLSELLATSRIAKLPRVV